MPAPSNADTLTKAVDDHIAWFVDWHRVAYFSPGNRAQLAALLTPPESFTAWRQVSILTLPQQQPAVEQLTALHEQLHTLAKLVLMKIPDDQAIARPDYESVVDKYKEFMQSLRRMERAFSAAASKIDLLTGLRTRLGLEEDLHREHSRFMRTGKSFCVAIMDVDYFKKVNDAHGHDAGDHVLAAVADHISRSLRPFDDAYRMGGEEFLLCLKEVDLVTAGVALERLRMGLEKKPVLLADGHSIPITASFGFTISAKDIPAGDLLKRADQALYRAKDGGRNRIIAAEARAD